jgi:hypothetical protein
MKIKASIKIIIHIIFIVVLTISTQIGGIIYLMTLLVISKKNQNIKLKEYSFSLYYT